MARTTRLGIEALENRLVPALTFQFDYRFDGSGLFNDPAHRALLEQAGRDLGARIDSNLQAITPGGGDTWSAMFFNPATGGQSEVANLSVPAKTVVVFVGSRDLTGAEAGVGGTGGYSANGDSAWFNQIAQRGQSGFSTWGGSLSFDSFTSWYWESDASALSGNTVDFYTVATHELGHMLGFGTAQQFSNLISGNTFTGSHAAAANGGAAPHLSADLSHWAQGTSSNGQPTSMEPYVLMGRRYGFTNLDYAALADVGWTITPPPPSVPVVTPPTSGTPTPASPYPPIVLTGSPDGLAHVVRYINGQLTQDGFAVQPFPNFSGELRSITADVNGDGVTDIIYATGPGGPSEFTIVDGATGFAMISPQIVFGSSFSGGLFLAAADFNHDGKADIVISPDQGGGGRVSIFSYANGGVSRIGDFFGIDDVNFRGGARVAAADLNGDGTPDLVVGAGFGGGPRIALFDGKTLTSAKPQKFVGDFFAFPGDAATKLRNGVYVAAGDVNGDGKADLIFGAGPGGGPQVYVLDTAQILAGNLAGAQKSPLKSFFAFDVNDRSGVRVAVKDVNGDGKLDLMASSGSAVTVAWYKSFDSTQANLYDASSFMYTTDGIYVGA
jgi:hypothetical protein